MTKFNSMDFPYTPVLDRIIARRSEPQHMTKSGLHIPDSVASSTENKSQTAIVIAVGPKAQDKGEIHVGDTILFSRYTGGDVKFDGHPDLIVMRETDVLAVIEQ